MLPTEPLSEPFRRVSVDRRIGGSHLSQAEVLRPTGYSPVQRGNYVGRLLQQIAPVGQLTDSTAYALDACLARSIANVGLAPARTVVPSEAVAEELHQFVRTSQASGLLIVDRQLQPPHEPGDRRQHVRRRSLAEHTEVIRIGDDLRTEALGKTPSFFQPSMKRRM